MLKESQKIERKSKVKSNTDKVTVERLIKECHKAVL